MVDVPAPLFTDKLCPPEDCAVEEVLGRLYPHYLVLRSLCHDFMQEWRFPGKKYGWVLKVERKRKAVFWLTPLQNAYRIGFIVRLGEQEPLLEQIQPGVVRSALEHPTVYPEGLGFSLTVAESQVGEEVAKLVREIIAIRGSI